MFSVWVVLYSRALTQSESKPLLRQVRTTSSTLRFVDPAHLRELLADAGFTADAWYGDWDASPVTPASPEVVVLAST